MGERKEETLHDKNIKPQGWFVSILKSLLLRGTCVNVLIRKVKQFTCLRARALTPENQREGEEVVAATWHGSPSGRDQTAQFTEGRFNIVTIRRGRKHL